MPTKFKMYWFFSYGPTTLKDNSVTSLADNKYHSIWIKRPSREEQVKWFNEKSS